MIRRATDLLLALASIPFLLLMLLVPSLRRQLDESLEDDGYGI